MIPEVDPYGQAAQLAQLKKLREDRRHFFKTCLKIRNKAAQLVPLDLNVPQQMVEAAADAQLAEKGWVRLLILKARQQGISTYIEGRGYHRTSLWHNQIAYLLTHEQAASDALFEMVERYHDNNPLAPVTGASNAKTLEFEKLNSAYIVATAGAKAGGRGRSTTFFHGSEVAFWPAAADHFKASVQTVPLLPGTEIFLESTANGPEGEFYERWQQAVRGVGDYIAVFIPWFVSPEYSREPEPDFELSWEAEDGEMSEAEYAEAYNLTLPQMRWRRGKIQELGGVAAFRQEYPANADEAFVSADKNSYIDPLPVLRARKREVKAGGPLIVGIDPAGDGGDRFCMAFRRGHRVEKVIWRDKVGTAEALAWVRAEMDAAQPARIFVDQGGLGAPLINMLKTISPWYAKTVVGVNFGAKSQAKNAYPKNAGPKNRRAEMWKRMKDWLTQEEGVQIPDLDVLQSDITAPWVKNDLNNDLVLSSKEEMRAKGIRSPDLGDALALTFAESVWVDTPPAGPPAYGTPVAPGFDSPSTPQYGYGNAPFRGSGGPLGWMR